MNQLTGKFVNVVLSVEDGRGMEFVRHPIHVAANYSGRILESDQINPIETGTNFNTELIWEVDKKDLRRMRSSNQPLRVECISTDPQNRKDRIGFVLLSLRSAQIIPLKDAKIQIYFKWHKLIGCQADKKKHHPELYLALTVRDHLLNDHEDDLPKNMPLISEEEQIIHRSIESSSSFPLKYLDDGYIQIGDDEDSESFSLNLLVREAKNLDTLLPEALVFRQNREKYHMTFKIFEVVIKTKPFYKNVYDKFALNEKVVVRILSNQETLFDFLNNQCIVITLFNGHEHLGSTEVPLDQISFDEVESIFFFRLPPPHDTVPFGGNDASPYLDIRMWMKKSSDSRFKLNPEEKLATKVVKSNLQNNITPRGFGDQIGSCVLDKLQKITVKSRSESSVTNGDCANVGITQSVDTVIRNVPLSPRHLKKYELMGTYVKFVLEVTLLNLEWLSPPRDKIVIFKFLHPRASNFITIFTQLPNVIRDILKLNNIGIKISYVSTLTQIENVLNSWPPKLALMNEDENLLSDEYEFDMCKFFNDQSKHFEYIAELKTSKTLQPLARLKVALKLVEYEIADTDGDNTDFHLGPPIVDEILTIKEIADLEKWKQLQRNRFEQELGNFKEKESERLENDWNEKKKNMEDILNNQMEKCNCLKEELQRKVDNIKTEKYLLRRRNHANIFEDIFNENWDKYHEASTRDIIEILSKAQRDNEYLRKLVEDQRNKLQDLEKTTLTREQTTNLLQELRGLEQGFEEAQKAKQYFKEQWQQACEEIHDLRTEEYKNVQVNLKRSREEIRHLSSDNLEQSDSSGEE